MSDWTWTGLEPDYVWVMIVFWHQNFLRILKTAYANDAAHFDLPEFISRIFSSSKKGVLRVLIILPEARMDAGLEDNREKKKGHCKKQWPFINPIFKF